MGFLVGHPESFADAAPRTGLPTILLAHSRRLAVSGQLLLGLSRGDPQLVDLLADEDPFDLPPGANAFASGLPLLTADARREVLRGLNRRRDWLRTRRLGLALWVHRDDVAELYELAPDLVSWVDEQLDFDARPDPPLPPGMIGPVRLPPRAPRSVAFAEADDLRARLNPECPVEAGPRDEVLAAAWRLAEEQGVRVAWLPHAALDEQRATAWLVEVGAELVLLEEAGGGLRLGLWEDRPFQLRHLQRWNR
ncbi:MAG: hypothetical protein H6739_39455 [Alphaproteobacteria bacterium]|nr:hypothetical protein [Alphaproteobacteria bacterium]